MRSPTVRRAGLALASLQPGLSASLLCMTGWLLLTLSCPHSFPRAFVPALPLACLPFPVPEQRWPLSPRRRGAGPVAARSTGCTAAWYLAAP